mmetsp:Transcript_19037/g.32800  ORF Transcript_19037/g.32800 Transcript_19037/m.32800 type:complete len:315 (+) Transcript_19037:17-961(+)
MTTLTNIATEFQSNDGDDEKNLKTLIKLESLDVTLDELVKTKVGRTVKKLVKSKNKDVSSKSSSLLKKWANLVDVKKVNAAKTEKNNLKRSTETEEKDSQKAKKPKIEPSNETSTTSSTTTKSSSNNDIDPSIPKEKLASRGEVRDKAVQLLKDALSTPLEEPQEDSSETKDELKSPLEIALDIEEALFTIHENKIGKEFKMQLRSLNFNLKNKKNSELRRSLLAGDLTPKKFVEMKPQDMADPEKIEERRQQYEWAKKVAMARAANLQAPSDAFTCHKCGKSETRYFQLQTRSADEPMTTFVNCVNCGKSWKQ